MRGASADVRRRGVLIVAGVLALAGLTYLVVTKGPFLREAAELVQQGGEKELREELRPARLFLGGRSMGGRAASMLVARGFDADGLILLAYPLHPAGKPEQLRDAHLPKIAMPVLCFNGTRDALCRRELMEAVLQRVGDDWTMHWLEGADHSFHVLKSSGRTDADVLSEIQDVSSRWLERRTH